MAYNEAGKWVNPISTKARTDMEADIAANLWKTKRIASTFQVMTGLPQDELESVARMCLMKCAQSYRTDAPANFSTWVNRCLRLHMLNFLRDKSRIIKIPRKYTQIYLKSRKLFKDHPDMDYRRAAKILEIPLSELVAVYACFRIKLIDINYFAEEVIGGGTGEIEDSLLDREFFSEEFQEKETDELNNPFDWSIINSMSKAEIKLLEDVLLRNLCNNTLERNFKDTAESVLGKAEELIEKLYYLS